VEPGRLLAGRYPAAGELEALLAAGVTLFLDLTEAGELEPYDSLLSGRARHVRRAVVDWSAPGRDSLAATLDLLDAELGSGGVVYVHCRGGCGRTGTVICAWWVRHGAEPSEALRRYGRPAQAFARPPCPETADQQALVRGWRAGA
jgi:hypothetical protein